MTATIENVPPTKRNALPARLSPSVAPKLANAEAALAELEARRATITLDHTLDVPGARDRFASFQRDVLAAQAAVDTLRVAQREAQRLDAVAVVEAKAVLMRSQLKALQAHARSRSEAAVELSKALKIAARAQQAFLASSAKMAAALPITCEFPNGITPEIFNVVLDGKPFTTSFNVLVAAEMFRVAGGERYAMLPGASVAPAYKGKPDAIGALPDNIREMDKFVLDRLAEQIEVRAQSALDRIAHGDFEVGE